MCGIQIISKLKKYYQHTILHNWVCEDSREQLNTHPGPMITLLLYPWWSPKQSWPPCDQETQNAFHTLPLKACLNVFTGSHILQFPSPSSRGTLGTSLDGHQVPPLTGSISQKFCFRQVLEELTSKPQHLAVTPLHRHHLLGTDCVPSSVVHCSSS